MSAIGPQISSAVASRAAGSAPWPAITILNARTRSLRLRPLDWDLTLAGLPANILTQWLAPVCLAVWSRLRPIVSRKEPSLGDFASSGGSDSSGDAPGPTVGTDIGAESIELAESTSQREMMRLVAQLYYVRELGQPEIAALTGFSISKVSRLLATARAAGVVRISVEGAPASPTPLARALSEALGLEVWVTPGHETGPALAARLCGVAAAPRLAGEVPHEGAIGLTGGYTVESLVAALPSANLPGGTGGAR